MPVIVGLAVGTAVSVATSIAVGTFVGTTFSRLITGVSVGGTAVAGTVSVGGGGAEVDGLVATIAMAGGTAVGTKVGTAGWDAVAQADKIKSSTPCKSKTKRKTFIGAAAVLQTVPFCCSVAADSFRVNQARKESAATNNKLGSGLFKLGLSVVMGG
jgi:hypothetical protein